MNEVKVYQCDCGEIMDETAYRTSGNGIHFNPPAAAEPCGGTMRERILADPAEVRRETIREILEERIMPYQQNDETIYIIDGSAFIDELRALLDKEASDEGR